VLQTATYTVTPVTIRYAPAADPAVDVDVDGIALGLGVALVLASFGRGHRPRHRHPVLPYLARRFQPLHKVYMTLYCRTSHAPPHTPRQLRHVAGKSPLTHELGGIARRRRRRRRRSLVNSLAASPTRHLAPPTRGSWHVWCRQDGM